jgi:hypothetical protein
MPHPLYWLRLVDNGDKSARLIAIIGPAVGCNTTVGVGKCWSSDMLVRPRDLADQMSHTHQSEIFTLPIHAARCKAREIIGQSPRSGFMRVIEKWRQLPDGQIEFAIRHFPIAD